jgi:cobalt-zinc-cadmium efflux system outer membrane protein
VRAAQARLLAAQANTQLSLALRANDITWGASYDHYPGTSTALLELRLQVPLQWGYSYQGEIARAQSQLQYAQNDLENTKRQVLSELQTLFDEVASASERVRTYDQDILPRARRVADKAELAYSKGALSLTDLLDARRVLRATRLEALAARTEHAKATEAWRLRTDPTYLAALSQP